MCVTLCLSTRPLPCPLPSFPPLPPTPTSQRLLSCVSVYSTILLAVFLLEEARHSATRTPRRDIWATHPRLLGLAAVTFVGSDLIALVLVLAGATSYVSEVCSRGRGSECGT